jgi:hypothetical protein
MKARFLAVLSALLVGQGLGLAERVGSNPGSIGREPPPLRNRSEDVLNPDGSMTFFRGGLYALRSNIGRRQRDELAFVPEVGLNVERPIDSPFEALRWLLVSVDQHGSPRRGTNRSGN